MLSDSAPYRWQDHVITPRRAAANLMVTAALLLAFGSALAFACVHGPTNPPDLPVAHAAVSEGTPPLCQLVKRPQPPHTGPHLRQL
jgi:hypothetical protein